MADGQTQTAPQLTPDQAVALMQYAYPGRSQDWYDIFRQNPSLALGANISGQGNAPDQLTTTGLVNMLQKFNPAAGAQTGTAAAAVPGTAQAGTAAPSYFGSAGSGNQTAGGTAGATAGGTAGAGGASSPMTWTDAGQTLGLSQRDINIFSQQGYTPEQVVQSFQTTGQPPSGPAPAPESVALQQMAQIDPASEALRQQLAQSYLANVGGGTPPPQFGLDLSRGAAAPALSDVQSYLNLYQQIDPTGAAARVKLGQDLAAQEALGTQLDPATQRQIEQATRLGQVARGNVYGTPQLVQEAMTTGQAGLALQQQRQQALQSYLSSGQTMGDVLNNLYQQGYSRYLQGYGQQLGTWQAQQNAQLARQGAALGYLGSGQTPFQAGSAAVNMWNQNAAQAAQGGPQYNPQALGQQYTGAGASSYPQYGLDISQLAGNWYNNINQANLQAYNLQQAYSQKSGGQGGALGGGIGTALGGIVGSVIPGVGTAIGGALGGALGSAAGSYIG